FQSHHSFDLEVDDFSNVIEEINSVSLFNEMKIIILKNITGKIPKSEMDIIDNYLTNYFKNPNPHVTLLIIANKKMDERRKLTKTLKSNLKVISSIEYTDSDYLKRIGSYLNTEGYEMSMNLITLLWEKCLKNYDIMLNELNKLLVIADKNEPITKELIDSYTSEYESDEIFLLKDAIVKKNINEYYPILNRYIDQGNSIIPLISLLANEYRLMYITKNTNLTDSQIARNLKMNSDYPVKLAREKAHNFMSDDLLDNLVKLADLDYQIKVGEIDEYIGFNMFLLEI
ncbi:MAG: DNA polymerase III subunit delta, partial [Mollicutes bacterium]|nr:DNA polymerase III subunit delta [Mollicutes bacterium]